MVAYRNAEVLRHPKAICLLVLFSGLSSEADGGAGFGFGGFFFAIAGRRAGLERMQQAQRNGGDFFDGGMKDLFVGLRRFIEAADFSYELQRSRANFFFRDRRREVEKRFDVSAHVGKPR
jgi:hypothetical protein